MVTLIKKNRRIETSENPRVIVEKPLHFIHVTVWCAFRSRGVIGLYFFENKAENPVTINGLRY